jgi:hypothetical protein
MDSQILAVFAALGAALEPAIETQIGKVPQNLRWLVPVIMGAVAAAFQSFVAGTPWQNAVANGVAFVAAAMVKHDYAPAGNGLPAAPPVQLGLQAIPAPVVASNAAAVVSNLLTQLQTAQTAVAAQQTPVNQVNHANATAALTAATGALNALAAAAAPSA